MTSAPPAPPDRRRRRHPRLRHPSPHFKGVRMRSWGRWVSEIRIPNSREKIWLGSYAMPELAARAYDAAYLLLRGRSAATALNFPDSSLLIYPYLATYMQGRNGGSMRRTIQIAAAAIAKAIEGAEEYGMESGAVEEKQEGAPAADEEGDTGRGCGKAEGENLGQRGQGVVSMESGWISDVLSLVSPRLVSPRRGGATAEYNRVQGAVNVENLLRSASSDDHFLQQALHEALVQDGFTPMSLAVTTRQTFDTDVACSFDPLWSYLS